jgi:exopolyphosphatase / guanosine-5'-triphosphate,3'-diphosphate pyrophosphatase
LTQQKNLLIEPEHSPLYVVIDLGSNSFHMLIARLLADSVQIVDKVKRKVRLASGLDQHNKLDAASMARGLECLSFFAERLQDIPTQNIRVVATATLRIASNAEEFLTQAEQVLATHISLLSGEQEAELIYLGVAHTNCSAQKRLIFDIGGASTEIIVGEGFQANQVCSLNMGCVTFNRHYFAEQQLTTANFNQAIAAAKQLIKPWLIKYRPFVWQSVLGGSGTMQALGEVLLAQNRPAIIDLSLLTQLKAQIIACKTINNINIVGLSTERKPVFASGVAILIALFESFKVQQLQLSSGAIREGLLYEMLPNMRDLGIRERTLNSLMSRFHVDKQHAQRVLQQADTLFSQLKQQQQIPHEHDFEILKASCLLHEVGLLLEYKYHRQHSAYILQQADLPGYDQADRQLLVALVKSYKGDIEFALLTEQAATNVRHASLLLMILRLAVILCRRRIDDVLPSFAITIVEQRIELTLPKHWLTNHPLIADELTQEHHYLQALNFSLQLNC